MPLAPYRIMWLFVMFDLPVDDKDRRREYTQFRKLLIKKGFTMLQFSVYAKHMESEDASDALQAQVQKVIPPFGQVRILAVTDRQFGKMVVFWGKKRSKVEDPPLQITLF